MSTYPQYTLKSQDVNNFTINTLDTLPLHMPGAIQSRDLLRVLVFAAAARLSVHQACAQLERAPSGPTVLGNLASQCSALDALEGHRNALLARRLPKGLGKRGRRVAVDLVALPYHGTVDEADQDEVCRSKAKCGTTHFCPSATAYAVVRGRRYTLAMYRVRAKQGMDYGLRTLLARVVTLDMRIKLLLLDRSFYSVRGIQDLITGELPFIMPAVKRGKKPTTAGGPTGTYALAAMKQGPWTPDTLKSWKEGRVEFDLAVVCHKPRGQRGRQQREVLFMPPGVSRIGPCAGFAPSTGVVLASRRPIGSRIKRACAPAAANRPCVCCLWAWRWCCAMCGWGCMPK
jgi:putative transposase